MDLHSRAAKKNTSHGNEVLPQDTTHLIQRPCYQRGSLYQDPAGYRTTRRPPDHRKKTQTEVVWTWLPFISSVVCAILESISGLEPSSGILKGKGGFLLLKSKTTSFKAQIKGEEDKVDRKRGGKRTSGSGQDWSSPSPRGQWRTKKMVKTGCEVLCGALQKTHG